MSFVDKEDALAVEVLVENLNTDNSNIAQTFSSSQFEQLAELSHELSPEMDHQVEELATIESEDMHEVIIQAQDIETELDKVEIPIEIKAQKTSMPPLRPLSIAPKPAKLPISFKPVPGQQLLLLQGGTPGQQLKLVSPTQGISLSNLSISKPLSIKTSSCKTSTANLPVVSQKQLVMKKVVTQMPKTTLGKVLDSKSGQQIVVVQKSEPQQIKLIPTSGGTPITSTPAKTLTLAQAQQMGIITGTKIMPTAGTKQLILNKNPSKTFKLVPQSRSPTKILPAPQAQPQGNKMSQRIFLKPASSGTTTVLPSQIIQVAGTTQTINAGQLHQINYPGKGLQYIKFVTTTQPEATPSSVSLVQATKSPAITTKVIPVTTTTANSKTGNLILSELKTIGKPMAFPQKITKPLTPTMRPMTVNLAQTTSGNQVMVLPAGFVTRPTTSKVAIPAMRLTTPTTVKPVSNAASTGDAIVPNIPQTIKSESPEMALESNGMRPRKPCNCTKSQCLKLYCDCFANGEFCYLCNCMNCSNNLEYEEHRQKAIKNCLERNPNAFRPKIGKAKDTGDAAIRKHTKGCNCKRSGCLKNYCECYEAKIACSSNCKCLGCRNIEDSMDKKSSRSSVLSESSFSISPQASRKNSVVDPTYNIRNKRVTNNKQPFNYITTAVIEATSHCLLTLANNAEECMQAEESTKKQLIEEFGRCLTQIIDCSITKNQSKVN